MQSPLLHNFEHTLEPHPASARRDFDNNTIDGAAANWRRNPATTRTDVLQRNAPWRVPANIMCARLGAGPHPSQP